MQYGEYVLIRTDRIYNTIRSNDEFRILVDRIWPRGISKERADLDLWYKEIAPSTSLRKWFGHKPERFDEFRDSYFKELNGNPEVVRLIEVLREHKNVVLLYSAKDSDHNQAVVLEQYLSKKMK